MNIQTSTPRNQASPPAIIAHINFAKTPQKQRVAPPLCGILAELAVSRSH